VVAIAPVGPVGDAVVRIHNVYVEMRVGMGVEMGVVEAVVELLT